MVLLAGMDCSNFMGGRAIQWVAVLQLGASGGFPDWPPRLVPASVSCSVLPRYATAGVSMTELSEGMMLLHRLTCSWPLPLLYHDFE